MSNVNKFSWISLVVLVACIGYLVALSFIKSGSASNGLECVYNCDGYNVMLESLKPSNELKMSHSAYSAIDLQPAANVQATSAVQKTQSSAQLHELSSGVEMTPLEMLRSGNLNN